MNHVPHPDLQLCEAACRGDVAAREAIAVRLQCANRFLAARSRRAGVALGVDDLADLAQDVQTTVWRRLGDYDGTAPLESWVFAICELSLRNATRKLARRATAVPIVQVGGEPTELAAPMPELFDDVHTCLGRLAPAEHQLVRMKHYEGRTFEDIAAHLSTSPNTIKARYYRVLESLRRCLEASRRELEDSP